MSYTALAAAYAASFPAGIPIPRKPSDYYNGKPPLGPDELSVQVAFRGSQAPTFMVGDAEAVMALIDVQLVNPLCATILVTRPFVGDSGTVDDEGASRS